jgi:uncharacterized protein YjbI with pentapeptide repeats
LNNPFRAKNAISISGENISGENISGENISGENISGENISGENPVRDKKNLECA